MESIASAVADLTDQLTDLHSLSFVLKRVLLMTLPPTVGKKCDFWTDSFISLPSSSQDLIGVSWT
jgi:hypothetical protein